MGYTILETDKLPEVLKNKPRWVTCLVFTTGILMITVSAVSIGVFIGYTYCYIEHRTAIRTGNVTKSTSYQLLQVPFDESDEGNYNRTINGALLSSVIVSKILKIGHVLMEEETGCLPWAREGQVLDNVLYDR
ncbi:uncharacterized protein LOC115439880 [Manduca sexta]|uniref:Uncharacterized protein n=1 Tax=Manduca sexta TaxID=7130 RepID=A0A921YSK9_MANSE|nr:uncharacterized protein LOC115439880 [Manduca sexta]KAG6444480.1 hypothetical protein O3G_MSEX003391 [Manduca sexta]